MTRRSRKCKGGTTRMQVISRKCMSNRSIYASRKVQRKLKQLRSLAGKKKKSSVRRSRGRKSKGMKDGGRGRKDGTKEEEDDAIAKLKQQLKVLEERKRKRVEEENNEKTDNKKAKYNSELFIHDTDDEITIDFRNVYSRLYGLYDESMNTLSEKDNDLIFNTNKKGQNFLHFVISLPRDEEVQNKSLWSRIMKETVKYFIQVLQDKTHYENMERIVNIPQLNGETVLSLLVKSLRRDPDFYRESIDFLLTSYAINTNTINHAKKTIEEEKNLLIKFPYSEKYTNKVLKSLDNLIPVFDNYLKKRSKRFMNYRTREISLIPFEEQEE